MAEATARPLSWLDGFAAHMMSYRPRGARFAVPACIFLISACFAGGAILEMRHDRIEVLAQAQDTARIRAADAAPATARRLDRYARLGQVFADSPQLFRSADLARAEPGLSDIIVWGADGTQQARLKPLAGTLPPPAVTSTKALVPGGLALRDHGRLIQLQFADVLPPGVTLSAQPGGVPVPGWPLYVHAVVDRGGALAAWAGAMPLYLFVIIGPAATGIWLTVLLMGAFARQAKSARAVRALKSTRPVEARLLVRLAHAERGAVEAARAKSEFLAHMSHELRTPLNAVIGFSEVIAEGYFGDVGHAKYGEYARDIHAAGRSLHDRIGGILEFANIEAGHFPLSLAPVELAALTAACLEEHQGRAFGRRIRLTQGEAQAGQVRADPQAVRRILSNLIVNALAYTAEGGSVRADIRFADGAGVVTLSDSGNGFSALEQARLGKPFARFDRPGATGAGLGVAIAMELARRMGGAMRLASHPGQGAVMEVRLPRL